MKPSPRVLLFFALVLSLPVKPALAYSRQGHQAIADLAYNSPKLKPAAKAAIDQILQGESVADAAEWPDAIKVHGALSQTPEAIAFVAAHPKHTQWHFVNFPVGSTTFDPSATNYAPPTNIVNVIEGCVAILENKGTFDGLSKKEALRYLIHLVGDIHQPLHTITGCFDLTDPDHPTLYPATAVPSTAFKDYGGNDLYYTKTSELHALWDDDLVAALVHDNRDTAALVTALTPDFKATAHRTHGGYHHWPEAWASDSMVAAIGAYHGLIFGKYAVVPVNNVPRPQIALTLPVDYKTTEGAVAREQVLKASEHLLQLFNAIHWKP